MKLSVLFGASMAQTTVAPDSATVAPVDAEHTAASTAATTTLHWAVRSQIKKIKFYEDHCVVGE